MSKKLDELRKELDSLIQRGRDLAFATLVQFRPKEINGKISKEYSEKLSKIVIIHEYQIWYSSALVVVKQVLPSRLNDFIGFYEYPLKRTNLTMMNFRVADAIRGHSLAKQNEWNENVEMAGWSTCYPLIEAQCNILESAISYFTTSLHEIQQVVQADLFDSELDAAREHRDTHTYTAKNWDEFVDIVNNKPGFIKGMWCGETECEENIKAETGATTRCMPFEQEQISDVCVCCGKPAKKMVYFGRAY